MKPILFYLTILLTLTSCTRKLNLDKPLPSPPNILGMYCLFSPEKVWSVQVFKLGSIVDYDFNNSILKIDDATVTLFCNNKFQEVLLNTGDGTYTSSIGSIPECGKLYYIEVSKDNFPKIVSDTNALPPKFEIDSIFMSSEPDISFFGSDNTQLESLQLDIFFTNTNRYPFYMINAGEDAFFHYSDYLAYSNFYKRIENNSTNHMSFRRCYSDDCLNDDDFNVISISYTSNAHFQYSKGEWIQEDAQHRLIQYHPGNVSSNIKNGLGLFSGINVLYINTDTLEIR